MKGNKYMRLVGGLFGLLAVCGCQQGEDGQNDSDHGTWNLPVSIAVQPSGVSSSSPSSPSGSAWSNGENPQYTNNVRPLYTDRIQLNIYKRAKTGTYADDKTDFAFDKKVVLTCAIPDGDYLYSGFRYTYATGVVNMQTGYEYRVTAIGYAEQRKERALFDVTENGDFSDAKVSLTDKKQWTTPELFFGTPRYGADMTDKETGTEVFSYESGGINALGGWLYRCVAGVELKVRKVPPEVKSLALLSGSMNTQCKATCYDDFLKPDGKKDVAEGEEDTTFVLDKWERPADWTTVYGVGAKDSIDVTMNESNLFPVTSALYVRIITQEGNDNEEVTVVPLRMKWHTDSSGTTTSPDAVNTDEQLANGILTSQRNHYYQIAGDYLALITKKLSLVIRINPNWDGDIDLTPGGK